MSQVPTIWELADREMVWPKEICPEQCHRLRAQVGVGTMVMELTLVDYLPYQEVCTTEEQEEEEEGRVAVKPSFEWHCLPWKPPVGTTAKGRATSDVMSSPTCMIIEWRLPRFTIIHKSSSVKCWRCLTSQAIPLTYWKPLFGYFAWRLATWIQTDSLLGMCWVRIACVIYTNMLSIKTVFWILAIIASDRGQWMGDFTGHQYTYSYRITRGPGVWILGTPDPVTRVSQARSVMAGYS